MAERNKDIIFIVFGEGFLRKELEEKILKIGLKDRFLLPGFRKDFLSVLKDIDLFVLPSFTEGLPNVLLEAYALKKPVVATKVGGNPEIVLDGETGFLAPVQDPVKLSELILRLTQDATLRKEMGEKGYKYIKEKFNFAVQTQKIKDLYLDVYEKYHTSIYYNSSSC